MTPGALECKGTPPPCVERVEANSVGDASFGFDVVMHAAASRAQT